MTPVKLVDAGKYFAEATVKEVLTPVGTGVTLDKYMVVLQGPKGAFELPAPVAGTVAKVNVKPGDVVTQQTVIVEIDETKPPQVAAAASVVGEVKQGEEVLPLFGKHK